MKKILAAVLALVIVLGALPSVPMFAYGNPNPDKYDNSGDY